MGFREKTAEGDQKSAEMMINQELKKEFSPEFINRIDDIIIFNPLSQTELRQICRLLEDPALARRLTTAARESCERYRWTEVRAQWLALYRSVTAAPALTASTPA